MDETTAFDLGNPESSELDLEVAGFREQFDGRSLLDQVKAAADSCSSNTALARSRGSRSGSAG
jgi:hypothetical protein